MKFWAATQNTLKRVARPEPASAVEFLVLFISDWAEEQTRLFDDPDQIDNLDIRLTWHILWHDGEIGPNPWVDANLG